MCILPRLWICIKMHWTQVGITKQVFVKTRERSVQSVPDTWASCCCRRTEMDSKATEECLLLHLHNHIYFLRTKQGFPFFFTKNVSDTSHPALTPLWSSPLISCSLKCAWCGASLKTMPFKLRMNRAQILSSQTWSWPRVFYYIKPVWSSKLTPRLRIEYVGSGYPTQIIHPVYIWCRLDIRLTYHMARHQIQGEYPNKTNCINYKTIVWVVVKQFERVISPFQ